MCGAWLQFNVESTVSKEYDFSELNGLSVNSTDNLSVATASSNTILLNNTLKLLVSGDSFYFPNLTFPFIGGINASNLFNVTFIIDGTLFFSDDRQSWPNNNEGRVLDCITFVNITSVTFTSNGIGTLNGHGRNWWDYVYGIVRLSGLGALNNDNRPRLFHIIGSKDIIVEKLLFKNSPYWSFYSENSDGLIVRYSTVDVRRDNKDVHDIYDLTAFNTDGFDVTGKNVYMHDLVIWNQDDCISVKDGSENMLFERITASGLGLVIGSIGQSRVNNITFRNSVLNHSFKGIYLKTRWYDAVSIGETVIISNILYENITINEPEQWAIWIGPAQQEGHNACSLLWPFLNESFLWPSLGECPMSGAQTWVNITLKDITINNPALNEYNSKYYGGVLLGNSSNPMQNVIFDNVVVNSQDPKFSIAKGDGFYICNTNGINGIATGSTNPVPGPLCFKTDHDLNEHKERSEL
eukprot:gene18039-23681_t